MEVTARRSQPDGRIVLMGVDEIVLPEVLRPRGSDLLLQADGADHWLLVAAPPSDWRAFGADVVRKVPCGSVGFASPPDADDLRQFVTGWRLGGYRYRRGDECRRQLVLPPGCDVAAELAEADATLAARDLVNTPSNVKNPQWLVRRARSVARATGASVQVLGPAQLRAGGFGGLTAVGAGSATPPRLVILRKPGSGPRTVLVGKGITFDSGGLSLKPRESMALMKSDMAGAAAVLSALRLAPAEADVTVVLGLAENSLGAGSYRPGDVITHVDGRTTEVRNTDAEGRLVLADLLAYAVADLDPDVLIDVATLTGAATMALSREMGAVFSPYAGLRQSLLDAADSSGEALWPMPLVQSYRDHLRSEIADQVHIPVGGAVGAGAITAALFLQPFAGDVPWAHLDIAGPARSTVVAGVRTTGGTGFGAALLGHWLARGPRF
ncbi:MAG TPA: leucyl aminopeptidase family protein [Actinomycetota bacterium]|nr:leucyl aminopeptidase family protein [Actinomycetota bacterium]